MLKSLVVTAYDEHNNIICGGSMVSKDTAAIPRHFWNEHKIVKILLLENLERLGTHQVSDLSDMVPELVAADIKIIFVSSSAKITFTVNTKSLDTFKTSARPFWNFYEAFYCPEDVLCLKNVFQTQISRKAQKAHSKVVF